MQGYIIKTQRVKNEDLIVHILSENIIHRSYRFYGCRHSSIMLGYKIDFELIQENNFLPRLRNVMHIGFKWICDRDRFVIWQQFIRLFYSHLKDVNEINEVYFNSISKSANRFDRQNPKRLVVESYIEILKTEGRLYKIDKCFICNKKLQEKVCLTRGFLIACQQCLDYKHFNLEQILELFETQSTININDETIDRIYNIILYGF